MGDQQKSMFISKQELTQSISNSTMCHTLSAAENLAFRILWESGKQYIPAFFDGYKQILKEDFQGPNLIFDAYDSYGGGKKKSIKDLIIQLIFLIENFKGDYSHYKLIYTNYNYPYNLKEEQVKELIFHWFILLKKVEIYNIKNYDCSKYYENLLKLLLNQPVIDYTMDIYKFEGDNPNLGKMDPKLVGKETAKAYQNLEDYTSKNAKNKKVELYGKNEMKIDIPEKKISYL